MTSKNKLYNLGRKIGLGKEEINEIIQIVSDTQLTDSTMPSLQEPMEVYPVSGKYGTISIRDLPRDTYSSVSYYGTVSINDF